MVRYATALWQVANNNNLPLSMCFATLIMGAQDCTAGNWNGSHLEPSCLNQIHDTCKNHCTMDQILGFDEDLLQLLETEFLHLLTY